MLNNYEIIVSDFTLPSELSSNPIPLLFMRSSRTLQQKWMTSSVFSVVCQRCWKALKHSRHKTRSTIPVNIKGVRFMQRPKMNNTAPEPSVKTVRLRKCLSCALLQEQIHILLTLFLAFHNEFELLSSVWDVMNITLAHVYLFPQWDRRCTAWVCVCVALTLSQAGSVWMQNWLDVTFVCVFIRCCPGRRVVCSHTPSFTRTIPAAHRSWSDSLTEESCSSPSCSTPSVSSYTSTHCVHALIAINSHTNVNPFQHFDCISPERN